MCHTDLTRHIPAASIETTCIYLYEYPVMVEEVDARLVLRGQGGNSRRVSGFDTRFVSTSNL